MSNDNTIHQNLSFILDIIVNHRLFDEYTESDESGVIYRKWTSRLNTLLQSKIVTAQWCGITLVKVTCQNSHELLLANAKSWIAQLLGFVGKSVPTPIYQESIETLSFLFSYTVDKPELQREVATPNLQRYNQLLLQLGRKQDLLPTVLSALTTNVKCFPSTARHISEQCLQLCLSCLDGSRDLDLKTIKEANKLLVSLYHAGGKSVMADQWKESLLKLIGSIHDCLNRLFDTVDEESQEFELQKSYPFLPVSSDYAEAFPILLKRIQLLQDCISTFLTTSTSIAVGVPIVHLIDLICRIYNVFEGSLMREFKDKDEFFTLVMCLPTLHLSTSKMFSSLLYCSGKEMMGYSKLLSRILLRLLNEHKNKRTLKISVYNLISLCLEKCGYVFAEIIHKPLISSVLKDLQIIEHKSANIVASTQQQKKSHKKRKTEITNSDSLTSKLVSAASTDVQVAGLQALATLLDIYGFSMENGQRASVDGTILSRLIQVVHPSDMSNEEIILVKAELYQCLLSSLMHPIETQASILPHACRLFSAGVNEQSHQLQLICKKGLAICDLIMHTRLPPIQRTMPNSSPVVVVTTAQGISEEEKEIDEEEEEEDEKKIENEEENKIILEPVVEDKNEKVKEVKEIKKDINYEKVKPIENVNIKPIVLPTTTTTTTTTTTKDSDLEKQAPVNLLEKTSLETKSSTITTVVSLNNDVTPSNNSELETNITTSNKDVNANVTISISDDDMDLDMEIPMIDMTGPDSDIDGDDDDE
ncbi:rRNA processing/ribosome biogenesis-domain-containing protein [Cokeromyces recurvatus]|uniref:rRNA processing/ribosome biogenesis-domain-containing protein n=1 Tax=Cokeromyces recurvatus TaxID=90255 RepID=UPI00221EE53D|nr:rRNA processing/ribosome biogenesis-domain-containing protein [Cokeromyces recurvatus]KAI7903262.1 rRNA processing/ribosome biogenesis-domain-containing protein [Cokeromyces recurvatus]